MFSQLRHIQLSLITGKVWQVYILNTNVFKMYRTLLLFNQLDFLLLILISESENCRNVEQFLVLNTLSGLIITHVDFIQFVVRPDLNFWMCACSDLIQSYCSPVRLAAYYIFVE